MMNKFGLLTLCLILCVSAAFAQNIASISGKVTDQSGGVLPGATIEIVNEDTGISRALICDEEGRYRARDLTLGKYRVQANLQGFQTVVRSGIILTVDREAVVDFSLPVGDIKEEVRVTGDAPLVNTTNAEMAALVTRDQIANLPLNARDFSQLITMQAGTTYYRNQTGDDVSGYGARISVSGSRVTSNSYTLDGSDINTTVGTLPSGVTGATLGVEAMREFKVLTGNYSAQYGRAAGANIVAVSRSGTNEFHGSLYEYLRNDNLDARNFFTRTKPEFKRNQFGASFGGPIVKNKAFFFGNYEGLRERLPVTFLATVPTAQARQGILGSQKVTVAEAVKPYLALWPLPNGRIFSDGITGEYLRGDSQPTNEDYVTARVDYQISERHSIFGRYTIDASKRTIPPAIQTYNTAIEVRNQYVTVEERTIFTPRFVNQLRVAYSRPLQASDLIAVNAPPASLSFVTGRPFGGISLGSGITPVTGYDSSFPAFYHLNTSQIYDDATYELGRHSLKFGFSTTYFQFNKMSKTRQGGAWVFGSLSDFLQNLPPSQLRIMGYTADPYRTLLQWLYSFYVQDDFRVHSNLTINLGVRYEYMTVPGERYGRVANLRRYLDSAPTVGPPWYDNPSGLDFAPRVGFAWDPKGSGKFSVRGSFGVFMEPLLIKYYMNSTDSQPPFWNDINPPVSQLVGLFPKLDAALPALSKAPQAVHAVDFHLLNPYTLQWALSVQKMLANNLVVEVAYNGARGVHLMSRQPLAVAKPEFVNGLTYYPPSATTTINPNFSRLEWYSTGASSAYHGFKSSLTKRYSAGLQFQVNYTWSKALDTQSASLQNELGAGAVMDPWNMLRDWGRASFHVAHVFGTNLTYEFPFFKNSQPLLKGVLGGWQVSKVLSLTTGTPFSAVSNPRLTHNLDRYGTSRADLVQGGNNNPVLGGPDLYFDPTQFKPQQLGYYGTVGRDTLTGPGLVMLDGSFLKNIRVAEAKSLQFRAEFFNLANHANFALPASTLFDAQGRRIATAGRVTSTVTGARQLQLALRFEF